jgi:antitoxin (DNA-binding transcriptional repressor) of toxin-antitoxin stability system
MVTRNGKPVAALIPISEAALDDWLLAQASDVTRMAATADPDLEAGRRQSVEWQRARGADTHTRRAELESAPEHLRGSHRGD